MVHKESEERVSMGKTNFYKEIITERFDDLYDTELRGMTMYFQNEDEDEIDDIYNIIYHTLGTSVCNWGISKFVFTFDLTPDIVFKVPFFGEYTINDDMIDGYNDVIQSYYESMDEGYGNYLLDSIDEFYETNFKDYDNADDGHDLDCWRDNYCDAEKVIYECIPDDLKDMFFGTHYLFTYKRDDIEIPVYYSDRATTEFWCGSSDVDVSAKSKKTAKNEFHDKYLMDDEITAIFIEQYGADKTHELFDFMEEYDIYDMHCGNVMFDANGMIRISDYSGFRE